MSTETKIDLSQLSAEQLKELQAQVEQKQKEHKEQIAAERAKYKGLVDAAVESLFPALQDASDKLSEVKGYVFDELMTLVKLKEELYNRESEQNTHTFSNEDGSVSIIIGYNTTDGWDDTVGTGITKVHDYIKTLATDGKSETLVNAILKLLSKDSKENLKASRVLQLRKMADDSGDRDFIDAMEIIQNAYKPVRTKEFVRVEYKGERGEKRILPLSITDAAFPPKEPTDLTGEIAPFMPPVN